MRPEPIHEGVDQLILATDGSPLTYSGLAQAIKRLGKRTGVPRLHSHLFRHTFAVSYLMNGGDIMTLRLILGHATLEVTQMYMHLAEAHVKVQHHRFSPVDRLGIKVRGRRLGSSVTANALHRGLAHAVSNVFGLYEEPTAYLFVEP